MDGSELYPASYDESSYPEGAESDSDGESLVENSNGIKSRIGQGGAADTVLSEDILCVVCTEILVEPCSLHCGHSFCQLCLAALWKSHRGKSPVHLQCPVCRQPWVNFPGVNIQLRNIIEKSHKALVESRCAHISEADSAILAEFKRAKDGEWQKERQQTSPRLRPAVIVIAMLLVLFCGIAIILTVVLASMLAFSEKANEFVQKPVVEWNNEDVMDWLVGLGDWASDQNITRAFLKERINGAQLKLFNQSTLKSLGIHVDYFRAESLLLAIAELKKKDFVNPRNFNEFMAVHRKKTVLLGVMYKLWPRFTFFYVYLFAYHDVFLPLWQYSVAAHKPDEDPATSEPSKSQVLVFGIEIVLVPHYVVGLFAWRWLNLHPWICMAILVHCVWATQNEAKKALSYIFTVSQINLRLKCSQMVRVFLQSVIKFVLTSSGALVVWPIIPFFLCDGIFYLVLWNTVYTRVLAVPWKLITRRRANHAHQQDNNIP